MESKIQKINNKKEFEEIISNSQVPVFVKFTATWCKPCQMMEPVIEQVASELSNVKFLEIDVDNSDGLSDQYFIMSVPTLMMFKEAKKVKEVSGALSYDDLKLFIEQ